MAAALALSPLSAGDETSAPAWRRLLWALLFGNFVIGSGVMGVAGMLKDIAQSLNITVAQTGILVSAASLTICLAAPFLAALTHKLDRRVLLIGCLLWYGVLHVLAALAPDLRSLTVLRVLSMLAAALFSPQAAASVGLLAPEKHRGRAIAVIFLGWTLASVMGMPLLALAGNTIGWRFTFDIIGTISLVGALWLSWAMPAGIHTPQVDLSSWRKLLGQPVILMSIAATALFSGGQFMLLAFFSPFFRDAGMTPVDLSLFFAWFGLLGFIGNAWLSRVVDRIGPSRAFMTALAGIACSLALWPLGRQNTLMLWLIIMPWGLSVFAANSAQQARLIKLAPHAGTATIALNASAMYGGQAFGAASGGGMIAAQRIAEMNWWALGAVLAALALSALSRRMARQAVLES